MESIGERLKARRKALGLTQADLAGTDVSAGMVSLIERDMVSPTFKNIEFLSRKLGLSIGELVGEPPRGQETEKCHTVADLNRIESVCTSLARANRNGEALELLSTIEIDANLIPFSNRLLLLKAELLFKIGKFSNCIKLIQEQKVLLETDSTEFVIRIHTLLARAHFAKQNYIHAYRQARTVLTIAEILSIDSEVKNELVYISAESLYFLGYYSESKDVFEQLNENENELTVRLFSKTKYMLSEIDLKLGNFNKARKLIHEVLAVSGTDNEIKSNCRINLAICEFELGNGEKALELLNAEAEQLISANEKHFHLSAIRIYYQMQNEDCIASHIKWALKQKDKETLAVVHFTLALQNLRKNNIAKSVEYFEIGEKYAKKTKVKELINKSNFIKLKIQMKDNANLETLFSEYETQLTRPYFYLDL